MGSVRTPRVGRLQPLPDSEASSAADDPLHPYLRRAGNALLKMNLAALRHVTISSSRIGLMTAAANLIS